MNGSFRTKISFGLEGQNTIEWLVTSKIPLNPRRNSRLRLFKVSLEWTYGCQAEVDGLFGLNTNITPEKGWQTRSYGIREIYVILKPSIMERM